MEKVEVDLEKKLKKVNKIIDEIEETEKLLDDQVVDNYPNTMKLDEELKFENE